METNSTAMPPAATITVPVVLTTSLSAFAIPEGPYMVPNDWRRTHLSTLVNKLIPDAEATSATPFDFIVNGQLLRTSLGEYLDSEGLTNESTLEIEYVRSTLPPTYVSAFEHDDWVASVDASRQGLFLTAGYDGTVRVFTAQQAESPIVQFVTSRQGSSNPSLTDARWIQDRLALVTTGMDGNVRLYALDSLPQLHTSSATRVARKWIGQMHTQPISSIDVASKENVISLITAGWDGKIGLWDYDFSQPSDGFVSEDEHHDEEEQEEEDDDDEDDDETAASRKRRKTKRGSKKGGKSLADTHSKLPTITMVHADESRSSTASATRMRVSQALFEKKLDGKDADRAWSAGWDGSVKYWNLEMGGVNSVTKTSEKVILAMDQMAQTATSPILVTGHMDRSAALWDMRSDATQIALHMSSIHSAPVSVVRSHPTSSHLFATASYDGLVKLWDTRSPKRSLFSITRPASSSSMLQDKLLALDWSSDGQIVVTGGQDKRITVHRGSGIGRDD